MHSSLTDAATDRRRAHPSDAPKTPQAASPTQPSRGRGGAFREMRGWTPCPAGSMGSRTMESSRCAARAARPITKRARSLGTGRLAPISGFARLPPAWRNRFHGQRTRKSADGPHVQRESAAALPRRAADARLIAKRAPSDVSSLVMGWLAPIWSCAPGRSLVTAPRRGNADPLRPRALTRVRPCLRGPIHDVQQRLRSGKLRTGWNKYRTIRNRCKSRIDRRRPAIRPLHGPRRARGRRRGRQPCHPHRLCITSAARIRRPAKSGRSFGGNMRP